MTTEHTVVLRLTEDQALVLFEWLARFNEEPTGDLRDRAEQFVLFDLENQLESMLVAPLRPDYEELLANARAMVRAAYGESDPG